jgi:hypothetical protein
MQRDQTHEGEPLNEIPAADLPLSEQGEVVIPSSDAPPLLPEGKTIHRRRPLPAVPTGCGSPEPSDQSDSPPIVIRESGC